MCISVIFQDNCFELEAMITVCEMDAKNLWVDEKLKGLCLCTGVIPLLLFLWLSVVNAAIYHNLAIKKR